MLQLTASSTLRRAILRLLAMSSQAAVSSHGSQAALRLRLVATRGAAGELRGAEGKYLPDVLLDLDYWALVPR